MKTLMIALLLLCTTMHCSCDEGRSYTAPDCCLSFISHRIPRDLVVAHYKTGSTCHKSGIIFFTKKGLYICADPSNAWVQKYIKDLDANS